MTGNPHNPCGRAWAIAEEAATMGDPWQVTPAVKAQWKRFPEIMERWRAWRGLYSEEEGEAV